MDGSTGFDNNRTAQGAGPIRIEFERLANSGKLVWNTSERQLQSRRVLHVLVGAGRGCMLHGEAMPATVIVPLHGHVRLADGDTVRLLEPGQLSVGEAGQRMQAIGGVGSLWVALAASVPVWQQLFAATAEPGIPDPVLLSTLHIAERSIRRAAVQLARHARAGSDSPDAASAALRFFAMLVDLQTEFHPLIGRCPGRTFAQRRGVFLRLNRVHNYMESTSHLDLGIAGFARMANYSACHFVRTFTAVYGETPHAVLIEQRLRRALRLVNSTALSITEIARVSGFEDRCAFARSFKRRFGKAASTMRELRQRIHKRIAS
jgi:AraC family transcriptional regulator